MKIALMTVALTASSLLATAHAQTAPTGDHAGHSHGEGYASQDHAEGKADEHAGIKQDLGKKEIGGYTVQVTQVGNVKAGEAAIFVITITGGAAEPKVVRAWVGVESGEGTIRAKAEEEKGGEWHAHLTVSKPMPAKSALWIELEAGANKPKASFTFKP
jgi:hypothetical protein